ncbi:hypothetical protein A6F57_00590 [Alteromonas stellipolaris]|uniref:hypothetical protein n=1 Tax=Alteromonas stellipolaris TaxID=233316 RepID=UPI0007B42965|nr:hypothetical protein [Alteromonas stellipolaris]ANB23838.1 hypothetical protein A6F57_00590 [Alteromonas stellipolaris]
MPLLTNDPKATDPVYINLQKDLPWLEPPDLARRHVEALYTETFEILDKKFIQQCKHDFHACYAEMYFAAALQRRSGHKLSHPSDKGPDFFIPKLNAWVEVVSLTDGEDGNPNTIPKAVSGEVNRYPEDQVILRMCNAFETKSKKLAQDVFKGLIKENEPVVICISGGGLEERIPMYHEGGYPQIVKALLPVGDLKLWFGRENKKLLSQEYKYRESIRKIKKDGDLWIGTEVFLNSESSHISAVIYSWANAANPYSEKNWGNDFYLVHNPYATNPLPAGFANCGVEYTVEFGDESFEIKTTVY